MQGSDSWPSVWAALSEESLEQRLRHYLSLATAAPNLNQCRVAELVAEAERRGKPELVEQAKRWVSMRNTLRWVDQAD